MCFHVRGVSLLDIEFWIDRLLFSPLKTSHSHCLLLYIISDKLVNIHHCCVYNGLLCGVLSWLPHCFDFQHFDYDLPKKQKCSFLWMSPTYSLQRFLNIFHQIWENFIHYLLKYCFMCQSLSCLFLGLQSHASYIAWCVPCGALLILFISSTFFNWSSIYWSIFTFTGLFFFLLQFSVRPTLQNFLF